MSTVQWSSPAPPLTATVTTSLLLFLQADYVVVETNSPAFPTDVSDYDTKSDGDVSDSDTTVDNAVKVTLTPAEDDIGNDFVDSAKGAISGIVTNESGGPLANATVTLVYPNGTTTVVVTGPDGVFVFTGLEPGNYTVKETNPPDYPDDVSVNEIVVNLTPGKTDDKNTFVDTARGNISGTVKEDTNNDNSGDVPLVGVLITLLDSNGVTLSTTLTDTAGFYVFSDVKDGSYFVVETNVNGTFIDVSDRDGGV